MVTFRRGRKAARRPWGGQARHRSLSPCVTIVSTPSVSPRLKPAPTTGKGDRAVLGPSGWTVNLSWKAGALLWRFIALSRPLLQAPGLRLRSQPVCPGLSLGPLCGRELRDGHWAGSTQGEPQAASVGPLGGQGQLCAGRRGWRRVTVAVGDNWREVRTAWTPRARLPGGFNAALYPFRAGRAQSECAGERAGEEGAPRRSPRVPAPASRTQPRDQLAS